MIFYMVKGFQGFVKKVFKLNKPANPKGMSAYTFVRCIVALSLFLTFVAESIQRGDIISALFWLSENIHLFFINTALLLTIPLLFIALTGSLRSVVFSSTLVIVLFSVTHVMKKQFLGDPLFPWDFLRLDQVLNLLPKVFGENIAVLIMLAAFVAVLFLICSSLVPRCKVKIRSRILVIISLFLLSPVFIYYRHTPIQAAFHKADIEYIFWVQSENTLQNGLILAFTMNLENTMIFQPDTYNRQVIGNIIGQNSKKAISDLSVPRTSAAQKPNIVLILNEAFWDPTVLSHVQYSEDPVGYFREIRSKHIAGTMISPVFGGSTANTEFEILTGLSTKFLPQGAIAYQQYIDHPIPALPQEFKENGYTTTAIHPYHDWFYKRNIIYDYLGFDHFYSLKDFAGAEVDGEYIGDLEVSKKVIEQIKVSQEPAFVFAITMQNHGPYPENRYQEKEITVSGELSDQAKQMLETYVQGLRDADDSLKYLIDGLGGLNEPTAVIFLGDHLPYLGKDYLVYKDAGYIQENENKWDFKDNLMMKAVPFAIWTNYGASNVKDQRMLSAQYLGHYLIDLAGIPDNFVFRFLRDFAEKLPVNNKSVNLDIEHNIARIVPEEAEESDRHYWLLEYDILFGEQYYLNFVE